MPRRNTIAIALLAAISLPAILVATLHAATPDDQKFAKLEKGRYLATAADCVACHTVPEGGKPFAGGRAIETPFGNIASANITPDKETGIGLWSDDDFDNAVRSGIRRDGSRLYPAMPYTAYTKMSRDEVQAIRSYLATVPPVRNKVVSNTLSFPFDIRAAMRAWDAFFFTKGEFRPNPQQSPEWNRGAFLVEGPGHCGACHTPKSVLGNDRKSESLQGSNLQGWFAPNITNDKLGGLGLWSPDDLVTYLKTGHNRVATATGPMKEEIENATSHMSDDDLKAIAAYLKSQPGRDEKAASLAVAVAPNDPMMVAGQAIYRDQCSACHMLDGKGVPHLFPSLAESPAVRSSDPASLIRVILRGARSAATAAEPTAPGMPSFGWQLNDDEVAAVATYIRNAWPPAAAAVSAAQVGKARTNLHSRNE